MSIDVDLSVYCDGCHNCIYDEHVYCAECSGEDIDYRSEATIERDRREDAAEVVKDWMLGNLISLSQEQVAFVEAMYDSIRRDRMPVLA